MPRWPRRGDTRSTICRTRALHVADGSLLRLIDSGEEAGAGAGELLTYDAGGVTRYVRVDEMGGASDVLADGGAVAVAVPPLNGVLWLDAGGRVERRWTAPGAGDAWHVNSLARWPGGIAAAAYGRFDHDREWVGRTAGRGVLLDLATGSDLVSGLTTPRDPRRIGDGWLLCEASERRLTWISDGGER